MSLIENGANPEALAVRSSAAQQGVTTDRLARGSHSRFEVEAFLARVLNMLTVPQKVILQLREEYPTSSVDGDTEAGAATR